MEPGVFQRGCARGCGMGPHSSAGGIADAFSVRRGVSVAGLVARGVAQVKAQVWRRFGHPKWPALALVETVLVTVALAVSTRGFGRARWHWRLKFRGRGLVPRAASEC